MAPTSPSKPRQIAFTLSDEEYEMLNAVAQHENRSLANTLRTLVRRAHGELPAPTAKRRPLKK